MPESPTKLIGALAYPGAQLLDITGPMETFHLASQQLMDDGERHTPAYRLLIFSPDGQPVPSWSGLQLGADRSLTDRIDDIDTLLIPGAETGGVAFYEDPAYIDWVRRAHGQVRRLCSVCSGALLLGAAGILDGRRATTHWKDAGQLQADYPRVLVEADRIYTEDNNVFTSGGITAGIDLALALVQADHHRRLALRTAQRLLVFLKRPGDQSQFSTFLDAQSHPSRFETLLDWITEHLEQDLSIAQLAQRCYMSERSFRRHFESELGLSPQQYLSRARVTKARGLLESTDLPLAQVARKCGFASADAMRHAFSRTLSVTPSDYRARFT